MDGMNFRDMTELQFEYGYPTMLTIIIAICLVLSVVQEERPVIMSDWGIVSSE